MRLLMRILKSIFKRGKEEASKNQFHDRTESNELAISKQHYQSLFNHNPDAIYSLDLNGKFLSVNSSLVQQLGYSMEEAMDLKFNPLITPEDLKRTVEHFEKAVKGFV